MKSSNAYIKFSGQYFFQFFALGAFIPLISTYLTSIGLLGVQIGIITSIGSIMTIFSPPIWGIVSDKTHQHKLILMMLLSSTLVVFLIIPQVRSYGWLIVLFTLFYIANSTLNPLTDTITLHSPLPFGKIRLWGSAGFAVAAFIVGKIVQFTAIEYIFYIYIVSLLIAMIFLSRIKVDIRSHASLHLKDVTALLGNQLFLTFMLYCMLIAGTLGSHNIFYGLLYKEVGGAKSNIGLAFLLFAASEIPFMQLLPRISKKFSLIQLLVIAPVIGSFRWMLHAVLPTPTLQLSIFFLQGIFFAPFIIGVPEFIRSRIPTHLTTTAMTLFTAIGFGIGGMLTNFISGILYDFMSAKAIYAFYSFMCFLAILVAIRLKVLDEKNSSKIAD